MFDVNEYFDGNVKSLAFSDTESDLTIGVMAPGEYEFGTTMREYMTVISGSLTVKLPDTNEWTIFGAGRTFIVEPDKKFQLQVEVNSSYLCRYQPVKSDCGCGDCDC